MAKFQIPDEKVNSLANICHVAAKEFAKDAASFRASTDLPSEAAERLARQFDLQEKQAKEFAEMFEQ